MNGTSRIVRRGLAAVLTVLTAMLLVAHPASQGGSYTVYASDGPRMLPYRSAGGTDVVSLRQVATMFGLQVTADTVVGGLTLRGRGQTVLLIPGQSFASIGPGRIVSLPRAIEPDGNDWLVPIDFLRLVIGPALGTRVEVRRAGRVVLIGDVRLPQVSVHFERQGPAGRLVVAFQPATPHQVTRQGDRLTIRFDAVAVDMTPAADLAPEFVTNVRVEGTAVHIDLGPSASTHRVDERTPTEVHIELLPPGPPPPPPPAVRPAAPDPGPPPVVEISTPGVIRTIVIDPGHGGDDAGAVGAEGTREEDLVLAVARQLKAAIESRFGLRVVLTRDRDEDVPLNRRSAIANNNKADIFISLHADSARRASVRGAQVLSLGLENYSGPDGSAETAGTPLSIVGGGTRVIDILPWDRAQIGFTRQSSVVAGMLRTQLSSAGVVMLAAPPSQMPLRPLVGVSMPAVLVDLGVLTNADDERALGTSAHRARIVDAILDTIGRIRQGIPEPPAEGQ